MNLCGWWWWQALVELDEEIVPAFGKWYTKILLLWECLLSSGESAFRPLSQASLSFLIHFRIIYYLNEINTLGMILSDGAIKCWISKIRLKMLLKLSRNSPSLLRSIQSHSISSYQNDPLPLTQAVIHGLQATGFRIPWLEFLLIAKPGDRNEKNSPSENDDDDDDDDDVPFGCRFKIFFFWKRFLLTSS